MYSFVEHQGYYALARSGLGRIGAVVPVPCGKKELHAQVAEKPGFVAEKPGTFNFRPPLPALFLNRAVLLDPDGFNVHKFADAKLG